LSLPGSSLLLKGAVVYDGNGAPFLADIGISGETISFIERGGLPRPFEAERVLDLGGLCLAPGFIDAHSHSDFTLLAAPSADGKVLQGITTEINGNCGLSAAPLYGEALRRREEDLRELDIAERWNTLREYFDLLRVKGIALNSSTLVGHGNIRASVMGYTNRGPSRVEMREMKRLLKEALEAGAIGLSTGLIYPPGVYAGTEELIELARYGLEVSGGEFIYASHIRSEGERLVEAVEEVVRIGRETGAKVHVSHIKTAGRENWHKIDRALEIIEGARSEGIRVSCDRYPYTAGSTGLDAVLPPWVYEGGSEEEISRLEDPAARERIKRELGEDEAYWKSVCISTVSSEKNLWMQGKNLLHISSELGKKPLDALFGILIEERLRVGAVFHSMSEDNLKRFLSLPYAMIGTDSSARPLDATGKPHPRGFGSFPRYLGRYAHDLERGIHKVTALPARIFGIKRRGEIKEGYHADMVAFAPNEIKDRATYDEPLLTPSGIRYVFVNGKPVVEDGKLTGIRPGRVLGHRGGLNLML
jgi:N-acyl-D-amino-acid deacylase